MNMVGLLQRIGFGPRVDPRILAVRVERGMQAVATGARCLPFWAVLTAIVVSAPVGIFGQVPVLNCIMLAAVVISSCLIARYVDGIYMRVKSMTYQAEEAQSWFRIVMYLNALLSAAWGLAPWLLWQPGDPVNHIFIAFMCLGVVARTLVSRSGPMSYFTASFGPLTLLLTARFFSGDGIQDIAIGIVVLAYAVNVAYDRNWHSGRVDHDAQLRFANEDLARELEEARDEALQKRAEAEGANASKTAFLANMSHELRTPLNAILGFSEIIHRECLGPIGSPRYKEYASDIHSSGTHLLSLINDLLDVTKIESGRMEIEPEMIETQRTLDSALKFVAVRARERNQHLVINVEPESALLYADERAVKQIVINLVSNAVKFTPDGGRIEVLTKRHASGDFELLVIDNGPGIAKDKVDRIFKPFSQIDNRYDRQGGGTGLGLALVRGLTDLHGGRSWIESEQGKGTCAHVLLPMPAAHVQALKRRITAA